MTQPRPAPKTPRPIRDDAKVGHYQVVVSFRLNPADPSLDRDILAEHFRCLFGPALIRRSWAMHDLDVAVREIGVGGERSEHEGTVGL
jgi:hypothetical protein